MASTSWWYRSSTWSTSTTTNGVCGELSARKRSIFGVLTARDAPGAVGSVNGTPLWSHPSSGLAGGLRRDESGGTVLGVRTHCDCPIGQSVTDASSERRGPRSRPFVQHDLHDRDVEPAVELSPDLAFDPH